MQPCAAALRALLHDPRGDVVQLAAPPHRVADPRPSPPGRERRVHQEGIHLLGWGGAWLTAPSARFAKRVLALASRFAYVRIGSAPIEIEPPVRVEEDIPRLREGRRALLRRAAGSPRDMLAKVARLGRALRAYADRPALVARLARLQELGYVEVAPTPIQLVVGSVDMLRFWITPAAAEYYASKNLDFTFHQILRVLEEPATMVDPTGFLLDRDVIIDHLLQVTHANPAYDLQLLESHERGLAELEAQTRAVLSGTHPKARSLAATVEDGGYHARLLGYVVAYRADREALPPIRSNVSESPRWVPIERTFGTLPGAMRYFAKMPRTATGAARHVLGVHEFPQHLAEA